MPRLKLNRIVTDGTDVAGFFIFHPTDLEHRLDSPQAWFLYAFACEREFRAGRLVAFSTSGDGWYKFRLTTGKLTRRERKWLNGSCEFRLQVRYGRVWLDNGETIPHDPLFSEINPGLKDRLKVPDSSPGWLELPNGPYRVIIHVIDWSEEPGAVNKRRRATENALPAYVVCFERVKNLDDVQPQLSHMPLLNTFDPVKSSGDQLKNETWQSPTTPFSPSRYLFLSNENWFHTPGAEHRLRFSEADWDHWLKEYCLKPAVWGDTSARPGDMAVLSHCMWGMTSGPEVSPDQWVRIGVYRGERLVRIVKRRPKYGDQVEVEAFEPPPGRATAAALRRLKQAFQEYTATNQAYRSVGKHPDFHAEMAEALPSAEGVCNLIIYQLPLPLLRKLELLQLSEKDRVQELTAILKQGK